MPNNDFQKLDIEDQSIKNNNMNERICSFCKWCTLFTILFSFIIIINSVREYFDSSGSSTHYNIL